MHQDFYDSFFGGAYSAYMERPLLARPIARMLWGGDIRPYYESMGAIGEVARGGTVVDCPCGAGPALRVLPSDGRLRYVAADLSPSMLRRIRQRARRRGLAGIEFVEAEAADLPLPDESVDLFLSYWGMHVFAEPEAAVAEIARVLRPGGRLVGATFVNEPQGLRQRLLLRPGSADFGPMCSEEELLGWLAEAGLPDVRSCRSGVFLFFEARLGEHTAGDRSR